jgi:Flp pilus assembly protein TadG
MHAHPRNRGRGLSRRGEAGVSAVEFGLILPIFMVLILGIIDYGYMYFVHLSMTNAAREGVRVGVTTCTPAATATTITNNYLSGVGVTATTNVTAPAGPDWPLQVNVSMTPFRPLIGFVPLPANLTATASMRWEFADAQDLCTSGS